tara:strand:+ start:3248 stop:3382 length:135 start_codon:yes stop_codon:yes gene_type:complete
MQAKKGSFRAAQAVDIAGFFSFLGIATILSGLPQRPMPQDRRYS